MLTACERTEYSQAEYTEPGIVYDTAYVPPGQGSTGGGVHMDFDGNIHLTPKQSVDIPAHYGVVFQCQHGKFCIDDDRAEDLYKRLNRGDQVTLVYQIKYRISENETNEIGFHFLDAIKQPPTAEK